MNKSFEKILERIDSYIEDAKSEGDFSYIKPFEIAKIAVQEVAEEYNGGWIACSERLPGDDSICIVTVEYPNNETVVDYGWFDRNGVCWFVGMQEFRTSNILAWQPLPEPFEERD